MRTGSLVVTASFLLNLMACRDRAVSPDMVAPKPQSFPLKSSQTRPPTTVTRVAIDTNSFDLSGAFLVSADGTIIDPSGAERPAASLSLEPGLPASAQERKLMEEATSWLQREKGLSPEARKVRVLAVKDAVILRGQVQSKGEQDVLLQKLQRFTAGRAIQSELEIANAR